MAILIFLFIVLAVVVCQSCSANKNTNHISAYASFISAQYCDSIMMTKISFSAGLIVISTF